MRNLTISIDERSLSEAKKLAASRGMSLNRFVRELIQRALGPQRNAESDEFFRLIEELKPSSNGRKWSREEIYEDALQSLP